MTNRGVFVSLRAALARGYRPLGAPTVNREVGAMTVRLVDRSGDVALAAMTDDEWGDHILHTAEARDFMREHADALGMFHGAALSGLLGAHVVAGGHTWTRASA